MSWTRFASFTRTAETSARGARRHTARGHSAKFLVTHRALLWRVTRNELKSRYAGSVFGMGWAVLTPLLLLGIYAVVYLVVLRVEVPGLSPVQYVLLIFAGLVPFLMTAEALTLGVTAVVANRSVLNNTVFPIDLAPAKSVLLAQMPMVVGLMTILVALGLTGTISWAVLLLPVVWGLHVIALIGLTWILSLVNLVFRDLQNLIGLVLLVLMVVSPIVYTMDMVPPRLRPLVTLNPFAYFVTAYQVIVVFGRLPSWPHCLALVAMSVGIFAFGSYFFASAKRVLIDYV